MNPLQTFSNAALRLRLPSWLKKEDSIVSAERVTMDKRLGTWMQWVDPQRLGLTIEEFSRGNLEMLARIWAEISERDDTLISVVDKRVSAVSQLPWEIVKAEGDDSPEAQAHKEALEFLYENLTATSVREPEETGGVTLLIEQMMESASTRYAVHELIWQPEGRTLTVTCNHLPLWYFEGRTGKLRYRQDLFAYDGIDLEPNAWMVTVGRGLIKAAATAFLFKHLPLKDWVVFSSRFGSPGVLAKTPAAYESPEWNQMVAVVEAWMNDRAAVMSSNGTLEQMELKAGPQAPFKDLVERMDRAMAIMYCGGDLSTLSRVHGTGANPQELSMEAIQNREAARITETLNEKIDGPAIQWLFGTKPRAWFQLKPPARVNVEQEMKITDHLVDHGVPVSIAAEAARFNRSLPAEGEKLLTQKVNLTDRMMNTPLADFQPKPVTGAEDENIPANEAALPAPQVAQLTKATAADMAGTLAALEKLLSGEMTDADLLAFQHQQPHLLAAALANGETAAALAKLYGTAVVNGLLTGAQERAAQTKKSRRPAHSPAPGA